MNLRIIAVVALLAAGPGLAAQNFVMQNTARPVSADNSDDVFIPISKYLAAGNADALSAWFADNLEIAVLSGSSDASRAQARQIVKNFFNTYTPRSFDVNHTATRANMKYALGTLKAGGETFNVTIFLSCKDNTYRIKQFKIERF